MKNALNKFSRSFNKGLTKMHIENENSEKNV